MKQNTPRGKHHLEAQADMKITVEGVEKLSKCGKNTPVEGDADVDDVARCMVLTLWDRPETGRVVTTTFTEGCDAWMMKGWNHRKKDCRNDKEGKREHYTEAHWSGIGQCAVRV